jgi:hypothetical protein
MLFLERKQAREKIVVGNKKLSLIISECAVESDKV